MTKEANVILAQTEWSFADLQGEVEELRKKYSAQAWQAQVTNPLAQRA